MSDYSALCQDPLSDCYYLGGRASVGSSTGMSRCMSPVSFTSKESNPKQQTSYNTTASRRARSHSDAVTYGGKCVTQRRAQFANHTREISEAVTGSCRSFWMLARFFPCCTFQQNGYLPEEGKKRHHRRPGFVFSQFRRFLWRYSMCKCTCELI